ncbi:hypothetical protein BAR24066_05474 [Burkholderia arboris]|uniref:Lysozyme inhibitor LprI-like N-terminal domain-containing protein n=1 Tax=Burkholderia arboris TaxID=488730 RepID=A0A9Q9SN48_9BURK|nr:lysozyme inhibitor LprI family protein [Burkholderia arboris]VWC14688.1 hypothetical protein BAR24066_05474 [Burkholderia arboris]
MRHAIRLAARFLAIAALTTGHAFAAADCEQQGPTMDNVRACILDHNHQAVDSAYQSLARKLEARSPDAASALAKSQASWTRFASDTCDYVKAANPGPMIANDAWMNCWVDFSQARVRILNKWAAQADAPPSAQK